jgi:S-adenosylmethionine synthetase
MQDGEIANIVSKLVDLRPYAIVNRFGLKNPIYLPTASYGHFGRDSYKKEIEVFYSNKETKTKKIGKETKHFKTVEFFGWEKLNLVKEFKKAFNV